MLISSVSALEVLDSRGKPTVRAFLTLEDGSVHVASVPSGASTGSHEACELRDGDNNRYGGLGVTKAVENINTKINNEVKGLSTLDPDAVDQAMLALDGTEQKTNLGANAILAVSMAAVRAAAYASEKPLWRFIHDYYFPAETPGFPQLMVNIVNGGKHANWNFDIQEYMVIPQREKHSEAVRVASEIFAGLGSVLKEKGLQTLVGDEGGYSPALSGNEAVFDAILEGAKKAGYENGRDFRLAVDAAATEWVKDGGYYSHKQDKMQTVDELLAYYEKLQETYNILSFEDPFGEDDWAAWQRMNVLATNKKFTLVGDDLYVTNPTRLQKGIEHKASNAILIKVNQIGTVMETARAMVMAKEAGFAVAVSHRSGETEDTFIADLVYGSGSTYIKSGSMSRSERLAKYNRLLEIEAGK